MPEDKLESVSRYLAKMYYMGFNNARNNKYTESDMEKMIDSEWPKFGPTAKELINTLK